MLSCATTAAPIDVRASVDLAPDPSVDLRVVLPPERAREAERYVKAASYALRECTRTLGRSEMRHLTLVDTGLSQGVPDPDAVRLAPVPWWTGATSMALELAAVRGVSGRCWDTAFDASALPPWFVDGLAEFTARRAIVPIFEGVNTPPGYAFLEERYFAGFVPRFVRIRLRAETDGPPVSVYRARAGVETASGLASSGSRKALAGKTVLALGTLERWLGRPVFDEIVAEFVRASKGRTPQLADFERVASNASGQHLDWFFDQAFRSSGKFDYGVETLVSEPDADGGFVTTVTARRYGEGQFTGASGNRIGGFDNGRGITLHVVFADGQDRTDWWDGRDERRTFRYRSPARAVSATIDPDRVLLLDLDRTNNSRTLTPRTAAAATRWASIYLLWLEHLLLSYASLA
jgi:hypothetical protein